MRLVAVSGTLHAPSKTDVVVAAALAAARARSALASEPLETRTLGVLALRHELAASLPDGPTTTVRKALELVRSADVLLVATPVYKGSYTGLLKMFFDLLSRDDLSGTPVVLAAVGGSTEHSLVIEHELRPLLGFFRADPVPEPLYLQPGDFAGEGVTAPAAERIARALDQAWAASARRTAAAGAGSLQ